ncbi:MAG TPA: SDR family oxidoreductase, partial [Amaricoccus sp.]|nr:SDR family oxidoreductase [Amaricoccus sp.]
MANGLSGKAAIVTGAARGIGLATARRLVRAGAHVTMADMDEKLLEQEVEALLAEGNEGRVLSFPGDTREKLTMANLVAATIDAWDRIDVLVNAGRLLVGSDPFDPEGDRLEASLRQNVTANLRLGQIVARRMIELAEAEAPEPGDRAIVNLSSVHARRSSPGLLAYSVSCAALEQLTRVMALALAPHRIRVNAIAVGGVPGRSLTAALAGEDDEAGAV